MGIHIRTSVEPLSQQALQASLDSVVLHAPSSASDILRAELLRYCQGEIKGRSFLIAGHRGAGKTRMVTAALDALLRKSRNEATPTLLRPLPVFLHGPSLLEAGRNGKSAEEQVACALKHVILGLHRDATQAFVQAFRRKATEPTLRHASLSAEEGGELAAQFEMQVLDDPPASRLREFYAAAHVTRPGVLFDKPSMSDQGWRELVALNGLCNAHQRIAGELREIDTQVGATENLRSTAEADKDSPASPHASPWSALAPPLAALAAGSAVTASGLHALHSWGLALLLGAGTAAVSRLLFQDAGTTRERRARQIDRVFIPDLSPATLDRLLPVLLARLRHAGLAPVLVIDELDKVQVLSQRLLEMVRYLKKLVAEEVFTCFLTDRGYLEHLRIEGRRSAYDVAFSYFSHPLLVTHRPVEFDSYLNDLLDAGVKATRADATATPSSQSADEIDREVLKWVLRHRSQLHAMKLDREIAALRGRGNDVNIPAGFVRSEITYRIDLTLQFAIELQLRQAYVVGWQRQRPEMAQALYDALYYLSRHWIAGNVSFRVDRAGRKAFYEALASRMNLHEVRGGQAGLAMDPIFSEDDRRLLFSLVEGLVAFLVEGTTLALARARWASTGETLPEAERLQEVDQSVWDALLLGPKSLLEPEPAGQAVVYRWRYWRSGAARVPTQVVAPAPVPRLDTALLAIQRIRATHANLWRSLWGTKADPTHFGKAFELLADQLRVLPTTPAWSSVAQAVATIETRQSSPATSRTLADACDTVIEFGEMLARSDALLASVLVHAMVFAGPIGAPSPQPDPAATDAGAAQAQAQALDRTRRALLVLSQGLGFEKLHADGIGEALVQLREQLVATYAFDFLDRLPWPAPDKTDTLATASLRRLLAAASRIGVEFAGATMMAWSDTLDTAWQQFFLRAVPFCVNHVGSRPHVCELVCAVAEVGPARYVAPNLGLVGLNAWSDAAVASLAREPSTPWDNRTLRAQLALVALHQAGMGNLAAPLRLQFRDRLVRTHELDPMPLDRLLETGLWQGSGDALRTGLLVRKNQDSLAEGWKDVPALGLVLSIRERDLERAAGLLEMLGLGQPRLFVEYGVTLGAEEIDRLQQRIGSGTPSPGAPWRYVFSGPVLDTSRPSIVNPRGPDELLVLNA